MGLVLVLASLLADAVEAFAQVIALSQQAFALLGVGGHGVQSVLQHQAGFAQLLMLQGTLFIKFGQLRFQALATQVELLDPRLLGRQAGLHLGQATRLVLHLAALLFTGFFLLALLVPQGLQGLVEALQGGFALVTLGVQALQLLATGQQAAFRFAGATDAEEVAPDPVAIAADQAFVSGQRGAAGQGLVQALHRTHAAEPRGQVES